MSIPTEPTDRDYFAHVFTAEEGRCRACGREQQITQWRGRHVERVDGYHLLIMRDRRCPDQACEGRAEIRRAPDEHRFALKKDIYGLDVLLEIADRRLSDGLAFDEIQQRLAAKGVKMCVKSVGNAFKRFTALVEAQPAQAGSEASKEGLRHQGGMVVLVDRIQCADDSPVLYVAIDSISRTVLFAERHLARSAGALEPLLERLKSMDVPIQAFVTDEEKDLVPAIRAVFPDVPQRFCQVHFLKRCAAPSGTPLARLATEVDRAALNLRKIRRDLARDGDSLVEREREVDAAILAVAEQVDEEERLMRLQGGLMALQHIGSDAEEGSYRSW